MPKCDLCGTVLNDKSGRVFPIGIMRRIAKHPDFSISKIKVGDGAFTLADAYRMRNIDNGEAYWRNLVTGDKTPWLLCSRCETSVEPFYLGDIRDFIVKKLVALETEAPDQARQWLKAVIFPFIFEQMRQICVGALASLDEAKASGKWSSNSFHKPNVSVYVTSFPVETQQARTAYYADGYFRTVDALRFNMKEEGYPENHLLHFQFFPINWETGLFALSLTVFPNPKVVAAAPSSTFTFVWPEGLLSSEERKIIDDQRSGPSKVSVISVD